MQKSGRKIKNFRKNLDRLRCVTVEIGRSWETIPPIAVVERLLIVFVDQTIQLH